MSDDYIDDFFAVWASALGHVNVLVARSVVSKCMGDRIDQFFAAFAMDTMSEDFLGATHEFDLCSSVKITCLQSLYPGCMIGFSRDFSAENQRPEKGDSALIPWVIEKTGNGERSCDIYSRLLKDRIIFIGDEISSGLSAAVIAQMLYLELENREQDISLYIMSPGGAVNAGMAIYDTMQHVKNDIATYCVGEASSMGAFLLAAGTKGKRFALTNARIMIHQPSGGAMGSASDVAIQTREMERLKGTLNSLLAKHTGKKIAQIERDTDRDYFMTAEDAKKYGIIDKVL